MSAHTFCNNCNRRIPYYGVASPAECEDCGGPWEIPPERVVLIRYTNYRGETSTRRILPWNFWWESTQWHPAHQWMLKAWDLEKKAWRQFAMREIHEWGCAE